jgi:hypothetical protein
MRTLLSLALLAALTAVQCKKDDRADAFIGTYNGTFTVDNGSGALSFDDVDAEVTKSSDDELKIELAPFGFTAEIRATATSESRLTIPSQTVFNETIEGTGQLNGSTLTLTFTDSNGTETTYEGERQ